MSEAIRQFGDKAIPLLAAIARAANDQRIPDTVADEIKTCVGSLRAAYNALAIAPAPASGPYCTWCGAKDCRLYHRAQIQPIA